MRHLSNFEKSTVISSKTIPVNIVMSLKLEHAPSPEIVQQAFQILQDRHPLLKAQINQKSKHPHFETAQSSEFEYNLISEFEPNSWLKTAEKEMMRSMNLSQGPLFLIHYFHSSEEAESVLLGTFHHSITDATGVINLLEEFLQICATLNASEELPQNTLTKLLLPDTPETHFPIKIRGKKIQLPLLRFMGRQMIEELRYQMQMLRKNKHSVSLKSINKIILLEFSKEETTQLSQFSRQHQITISNLLNAAILFVIWQNLLEGKSMPLRAFTFADLRPYLDPPISNEHTAPHIAMMRHTIFANEGENILDLAKKLNLEVYQSFKRDEKFLFNIVSDKVMQMAIMMKQMKMANSALSYSGQIPLKEIYGDIKVNNLHGFISTPPFGPALAAEAGILHGKLFVDFIYQDRDMSKTRAHESVQEIKKQLLLLL